MGINGVCSLGWLQRLRNAWPGTAQSPEEQSDLMHFHLLFISNQCWEHRDELSGVNLTRFRSNDFRMTFSPIPPPQKTTTTTKQPKSIALNVLAQHFSCCWFFSLCAFPLIKSCPLRQCVSSGTLTHSVPASSCHRALL